jgi:hypothetical protein
VADSWLKALIIKVFANSFDAFQALTPQLLVGFVGSRVTSTWWSWEGPVMEVETALGKITTPRCDHRFEHGRIGKIVFEQILHREDGLSGAI